MEKRFTIHIEEQSKDELNRCLQVFYASVRQKNGSEFKVSSLRAIRGVIERYLKQPPNNKHWSVTGDSEFAKANQTLNAICKNMMKEGKVGPVVHKPASDYQRTNTRVVQKWSTWRPQHKRSLPTTANGLVLLNTLLWKTRAGKSKKTH